MTHLPGIKTMQLARQLASRLVECCHNTVRHAKSGSAFLLVNLYQHPQARGSFRQRHITLRIDNRGQPRFNADAYVSA